MFRALLANPFPIERPALRRSWTVCAALLVLLGAAGSALLGSRPASAAEGSPVGLLVMAHGGDPAWDRAVKDAVAPLRGEGPVEIAFGMADRASLQTAVRRLEEKGAKRIAVVRLFISGDSFKHQTEFLLGLRPDPPAQFISHQGHGGHGSGHDEHAGHGHDHAGHAGHAGHGSGAGADSTLARQPIERTAELALSGPGLADDTALLATVLGERAAALGKQPKKEAILFLGHGVENDAENAQIMKRLDSVSREIARKQGFASVRVEGLREDWREKRAEAEKRIRDYVTSQAASGRKVLVIPVRVYGFGPYREVLGDLAYTADEEGLLPHPAVTGWIARQYEQVCRARGWQAAALAQPESDSSPKGSN